MNQSYEVVHIGFIFPVMCAHNNNAVVYLSRGDGQVEATQIMRIRDNIVRMYSMMTGQTQEQITIVSFAHLSVTS